MKHPVHHIVGLHGMPRCGKDTVAKYAEVFYGYKHLKFATHLYREAAEAFDVTVEQLATDEWKTQPQVALAPWLCRDAAFAEILREHFPAGTLPTSRRVLQLWGTEYRRAQDDLYWVKRLDNDMAQGITEGYTRFVISDVREQHEAEWHVLQVLRNIARRAEIVEIVRPEHGAVDIGGGKTHKSDARLHDRFIDLTIHNDLGLHALHMRVEQIFNPAHFRASK